jgi:GNAT superfamily N-acetyltransferase
MDVTVKPLTPDLWPELEGLFGPSGAVGGCWCMYWRIGAQYRHRPREQNRADFQEVVEDGPPPGLLAFRDGLPVGWCQVTPRSAVSAMERVWRVRAVDDVPVWAISCLYIRKGHRRQGVTTALVLAAIDLARAAGTPAVEAYPLDASQSPSASGTGYASTFERVGFAGIARHSPERPIMRLELPAAPGPTR